MTDTQTQPERGYTHAVLAQCGMPRRRVAGNTYERRNGSASLLLRAGELWDGHAWQLQPLPYGTRPRLMLIHVSTQAVLTRSRVVDVGPSLRDFLRRIGVDTNGREYATCRTQLRALAACDMRLGIGGDTLFLDKPIEALHATQALWPGTITLSTAFHASLLAAPMPLDLAAVAQLKHSALALDLYTWLSHRLCRVRAPVGDPVSWIALRDQFGGYCDLRNFRRETLEALDAVQAAYPGARMQRVRGGLRLLPSPPPVAKLV